MIASVTRTSRIVTGAYRIMIASLALTLSVQSAEKDFTSYPYFNETPQQRDARMAWWREAKFGMFIHWGIYAIPASGEWYMRNHQTPLAEYAKYARQFNPTKFNADEWMALAHDAGMKYLVITSKHHDGFAMFDSKASAYNIVAATPFKRDPLKELAAACPRHGIRFGVYYSGMADWGHPGGGAGGPGHWDKPAQDGDPDAYIDRIAVPQIRELMTNYGTIGELWFDNDGSPGMTPARANRIFEQVKLQPGVIIDPRLGRGDFDTAEQHMPTLRPKRDWELCGTVNGAWGYKPVSAKPLNKLLPYVITAWGLGGNVLMNVGPDSTGVIPADSAQRLREIGDWLKVYGDSIYGSTGGPFTYLPWGAATRKGGTVYLHVFEWPADGRLKVPLLNTVKQAALLGPGNRKPLKTSRENGRLVVQLPASAPDPIANVVALALEGEPQTDYLSVVLNQPVKASAAQNSAAAAVDDNQGSSWQNPEPTGWLEIDLGKPVTVATLRVNPGHGSVIKKYALEYQVGAEWKPILTGEKLSADGVVKDFPPVKAQVFRLNILESENAAQISNLELYPPF